MDMIQYFKDSSNYWYKECAKETQLRADAEERLSKANALSLERYEVGEELIKENDKLRSSIAELLELASVLQ
jgi:vacuolar-type H+-ATPase catalytic subunit A/Vma1